jgi:hypothetical protein
MMLNLLGAYGLSLKRFEFIDYLCQMGIWRKHRCAFRSIVYDMNDIAAGSAILVQERMDYFP